MKLARALHDIGTVKALLTGAEDEAHRAGDALPGAEHLLLAALGLPDGSARRAFERIGADPDQFRGAIGAAHAEALRGIGILAADDASVAPTAAPAAGAYRGNASLDQAFQAAVKLSKAAKPAQLLGAHVVVAVSRMEHGTTARALAALGIDRTALGLAADDELRAGR